MASKEYDEAVGTDFQGARKEWRRHTATWMMMIIIVI